MGRPKGPSRLYLFNGIADTLAGHARRAGLNLDTVRHRLAYGWPLRRALTVPLRPRGKRKRKPPVADCPAAVEPMPGDWRLQIRWRRAWEFLVRLEDAGVPVHRARSITADRFDVVIAELLAEAKAGRWPLPEPAHPAAS